MEEYETDFLKQQGAADQQTARVLDRLEIVKAKHGIEPWIKMLAYHVAHYEDPVYGAESIEGRTVMGQLDPILKKVYEDPVLSKLYEQAYQKELEIQQQQHRGNI